jgi:hypothetical protein
MCCDPDPKFQLVAPSRLRKPHFLHVPSSAIRRSFQSLHASKKVCEVSGGEQPSAFLPLSGGNQAAL